MSQELNWVENLSNYQDVNFPRSYYQFLKNEIMIPETFILEGLQKIYQSGRLSGTRLLDFACGPVITKIASASLQFQEIVLSDVSAVCRDEVEKWLREDKDALDWTPFLEKCAWAEGFRNLDEGVSEIEKRIRGAVKKVVFCDAVADNILPDRLGEFDVINLSRCLETCCSTIEMYTEALKKLTKHLKKGGALVMVSVLEGQSYTAHKTFKVLYLTEKSIKEALVEAGLVEAGMELRDWICWMNTRKYESAPNNGFIVHYSIKL